MRRSLFVTHSAVRCVNTAATCDVYSPTHTVAGRVPCGPPTTRPPRYVHNLRGRVHARLFGPSSAKRGEPSSVPPLGCSGVLDGTMVGSALPLAMTFGARPPALSVRPCGCGCGWAALRACTCVRRGVAGGQVGCRRCIGQARLCLPAMRLMRACGRTLLAAHVGADEPAGAAPCHATNKWNMRGGEPSGPNLLLSTF